MWSARERTAIARMDPEYSDIDVKHFLSNATREGRKIFKLFSGEEKCKHQAANKMRWDECRRPGRLQDERVPKERRGSEDRDKQAWAVDNEDRAKTILKFVKAVKPGRLA